MPCMYEQPLQVGTLPGWASHTCTTKPVIEGSRINSCPLQKHFLSRAPHSAVTASRVKPYVHQDVPARVSSFSSLLCLSLTCPHRGTSVLGPHARPYRMLITQRLLGCAMWFAGWHSCACAPPDHAYGLASCSVACLASWLLLLRVSEVSRTRLHKHREHCRRQLDHVGQRYRRTQDWQR